MEASWGTFVFYFLAGLAVNLTPCVYPMLAVTLSIFRAPTGGRRTGIPHSLARAVVYISGLALMYSVLGLIAALTGGLFGGILQNRWVVLSVGVLMAVLGLSMFGVFRLQAPAALMRGVERIPRGRMLGLFLSGVGVGVFAAPCIGPPVLALLTDVAARGDPFFGFVSFFIFALGLGLPYLLLGTFSGLADRIPRSGAWLVWVEHAFGVVLFGFAAYYLAVALVPAALPWVFPITLIVGGGYLGFLERAGGESMIFRRVRAAAGIGAVIFGASAASALVRPAAGMSWEPYSEERLAAAARAHRPVVIDFYADWCLSCHEMETMVFSDPEVVEELRRFERLRLDATVADDPAVQEVLQRYEVFGLPIVVFLDGDGTEALRIVGTVSAKEFLDAAVEVR